VLAVGVSYKGGVGDIRESPSLTVMERLIRRGAEVVYHDPHVRSLRMGDRTFASVPLDEATVGGQDLVAILTAHPEVDHALLVQRASLVFDARGVTFGIEAPHVSRL
jgi:UDP-N-acetyl-D-glucosamine dehydrogenase